MQILQGTQSSGGIGGARARLNEHPVAVGAVVAIAVALVLAIRCWPTPAPRAFYTVDDGQTFFPHAYEVPPFHYAGKEAVQAMVFTADGGKTKFAGYLMRFTPEGKARMQERLRHRSPQEERSPLALPAGDVQVKRPGGGEWVSQSTPQDMGERMKAAYMTGKDPRAARKAADAYGDITNVKTANGRMAVPVGAD